MNTTVNNVKKEIVVSFSKNEVEKKMKYLCTHSEYYKSFDESEKLLGLYKYHFKKPISGLVDVGMQVHITLFEEGENKTKITIEVVDNWNGTDEFDIDSSNILIGEVTKSLTHILETNINDLENERQPQKKKMNGCLKAFLIGIGIFVVLSVIVAICS